MPGFPRPSFPYAIDVARERRALRDHRTERGIPDRDGEHVLLASWNVANLGAPDQVREPECFELIAEIIGGFDLVAMQEIRDDTGPLRAILKLLPEGWRMVFSEAGGNDERFGFLWDSRVVSLGELIGKVTFAPHELPWAGGRDFRGFSRTPYIGTFHRGELALELVNVHSFFGEPRSSADMARRLAETRAIGWWCERRSEDPDSYTRDIMAMGDFNTPSEDDSELAEQMLGDLRRRGLHTPTYRRDGDETMLETVLGTAVRSENHYDQLLFFPPHTGADLVATGVFDFDAVVFHDLWESNGETDFDAFTAWAISDHRPLWAQLRAPDG